MPPALEILLSSLPFSGPGTESETNIFPSFSNDLPKGKFIWPIFFLVIKYLLDSFCPGKSNFVWNLPLFHVKKKRFSMKHNLVKKIAEIPEWTLRSVQTSRKLDRPDTGFFGRQSTIQVSIWNRCQKHCNAGDRAFYSAIHFDILLFAYNVVVLLHLKFSSAIYSYQGERHDDLYNPSHCHGDKSF